MPSPADSYSLVYDKSLPTYVSRNDMIHYVFPSRDEAYSTAEVDHYRFPVSHGTFWINFRLTCFSSTGMLRTEPLSVRLMLWTADGARHELISSRMYPSSTKWRSCRWALPSLPCDDWKGIWLEVRRNTEPSVTAFLRVELQGVQGLYKESPHYILIDEEDRHRFLFHYQKEVGQKKKKLVGSIHNVLDEDLPATHGVSPIEVDGIPIFPLAGPMQHVFL